jgi:hypothetical protein
MIATGFRFRFPVRRDGIGCMVWFHVVWLFEFMKESLLVLWLLICFIIREPPVSSCSLKKECQSQRTASSPIISTPSINEPTVFMKGNELVVFTNSYLLYVA